MLRNPEMMIRGVMREYGRKKVRGETGKRNWEALILKMDSQN